MLDLLNEVRVHCTQGANQLEDQLMDLVVLLGLHEVRYGRQDLGEVEVGLYHEACVLDDRDQSLNGLSTFEGRTLVFDAL